MFKAFKLEEWTVLTFFQTLFFPTKYAPFYLKIEEEFKNDDYKGEMTKIDENDFL
jgi:hypothetical protein